MAAIRSALEALVRETLPAAKMTFTRDNGPFATREPALFEPLLGDAARAPIDLAFWTEASLLMAKGIDAVVFGPGDIAQAHGPDEWVRVDEIYRARDIFRSMFESR